MIGSAGDADRAANADGTADDDETRTTVRQISGAVSCRECGGTSRPGVLVRELSDLLKAQARQIAECGSREDADERSEIDETCSA